MSKIPLPDWVEGERDGILSEDETILLLQCVLLNVSNDPLPENENVRKAIKNNTGRCFFI
jgi:hypothetical protein